MPQTNLSEQFKAFAGRAVNVTEKPYTQQRQGKKYHLTSVTLDPNDPAIAELTAAVQAAGYHLRLWLPDTAGTMDYRLDRLNAHVAKGDDGVYRIGAKFDLG